MKVNLNYVLVSEMYAFVSLGNLDIQVEHTIHTVLLNSVPILSINNAFILY